jgi:hypothetical protein
MLLLDEKYGRPHLALDKIIRPSILVSMEAASVKESPMTQMISMTGVVA